MADPFDRTKNYRKLNFIPGQLGFDQDFNHANSLQRDQVEQISSKGFGWQLCLVDALDAFYHFGLGTSILVNDAQAADTTIENGIYYFSMVDSTHLKWKNQWDLAWDDNGGAGYAVVCDGVTVNHNPGLCGLDLVLDALSAPGDRCSVIVASAMRLLGGEIEYLGVANQVTMGAGQWLLGGRWVDLPSTNLAGLADNDYIYIRASKSTIDHSTDTSLGHRLADGRYNPLSPTAEKVTYTLLAGAQTTIPQDGLNDSYFILAKVDIAGGVVTVSPVWPEPLDLQRMYKLLSFQWGSTVPSTPLGLTLTSDSNTYLSGATVQKTEGDAYLHITCTDLSDDTVRFYEFKITQDTGVAPNPTITVVRIPRTAGSDPNTFLPNLIPGSSFDVQVRAVNFAGRYSAWSSTVSQRIGDTCQLVGAAPTYTLEKALYTEDKGFWIRSLAYPATPQSKALGVSVFVREGVTPGTSQTYFHSNFVFGGAVGEVRDIFIPWEGTHPYVVVRAYDECGVYHANSVASDLDTTVCAIGGAVAAPGISITRYDSNLVKIAISSVPPAEAFYFGIWAREGAAPTATDQYLIGYYKASQTSAIVPWSQIGNINVLVKWCDYWQIPQTLSATGNLVLTKSLIGALDPAVTYNLYRIPGFTEGFGIEFLNCDADVYGFNVYARFGHAPTVDPESLVYHFDGRVALLGATFSLPIPYPLGSVLVNEEVQVAVVGFDRWGNEQALYTVKTLYLGDTQTAQYQVGKTGPYTTIQSAIRAIDAEAPTEAEILIAAGVYTENLSFPAGFATRLVIRGQGQASIVGDINLDNLPGDTPSAGEGDEVQTANKYLFNLVLEDLDITGHVVRADQNPGVDTLWKVLVSNCKFFADSTDTDSLVDIDQSNPGGNVWFAIRFDNCHFYHAGAVTNVLTFGDKEVDWILDHCSIRAEDAARLIYYASDSIGMSSHNHRIAHCSLCNGGAHATFILEASHAHVVFHHNSWYCTSGSLANGGVVAEIGSVDTNTEFAFDFLDDDNH